MRPAAIARFGIIVLVVGWFALFVLMNGCKQKSPVAVTTSTAPAASTAPTAPPSITVEAVDHAISKAVHFLYDSRHDGQWGVDDPHEGGIGEHSALVLRGLLAAGQNPQLDEIKYPLLRHLKAPLLTTQALADRIQLCVMIGSFEGAGKQIKSDADNLIDDLSFRDRDGAFHPRSPGNAQISMPASAQATRALAQASRRTAIPGMYWQASDAAWRKVLHRELTKGPPVSPNGLTADDLMPLMRAIDIVTTTSEQSPPIANGKPAASDKLFDTALIELQSHYTDLYRGPGEFEAMEVFARIMSGRGIRWVGNRDWYRDGVALLLAVQKPDGSWGNGVRDTAHALLFLTRGRGAVIFNKLQYASDDPRSRAAPEWNRRPYDLAHLTRWESEQLRRNFDWRVVSIDAPTEEWLEAPILYISGNSSFEFNVEHRAKLKRYIEQGGLVVGNAEEGNSRFSASFEKLGQQLFPYEFRKLPFDHLIYRTLSDSKNWPMRSVVRGLSNGARELMLLLSDDPAANWERNVFVGDQAKGSGQLGMNLVSYATDSKFKFKEEFFAGAAAPQFIIGVSPADLKLPAHPEKEINDLRRDFAAAPSQNAPSRNALPRNAPPPAVDPGPSKSVTLALISASAEPVALPQFEGLRTIIHRKDTALHIDPVVLGKWTLVRYETASIAADRLRMLDPLQRLEIKRFVETGGTLLIDASTRPNQFAVVEAQLEKIVVDPKVKFGAVTDAEKKRFHLVNNDVRIGLVSGRAAIVVNGYGPQNEAILEVLLSEKAK